MGTENLMQLLQSLIWLLAGVGVFIVGMNFMGDALEKSAGNGMKTLLGKISNNRFSGVGIGAGVTAIIQSSSEDIGSFVCDGNCTSGNLNCITVAGRRITI